MIVMLLGITNTDARCQKIKAITPPTGFSIYVKSNGGSDKTGDGSLNKPYKTIGKADSLAKVKLSNLNVTIYLFEGVYNLFNPVTKLAYRMRIDVNQGFPNTGKSLTYKAYLNQPVVISGGYEIPPTSWHKESPDSTIWYADLDSLNLEGIRQVYINGNRGKRAQLEILDNQILPDTRDTLFYYFGEGFNPSISNMDQLEVVTQWAWKYSYYKVTDNYLNSNNIYVSAVENNKIGHDNNTHDIFPVVALENSYSFIDETNEWFYDRISTTKKLYIKTAATQIPDSFKITIPILDTLVSINGIDNVTFDGITFAYGTWKFPFTNTYDCQLVSYLKFDPFSQLLWIPGSIEISNTNNTIIKNCNFEHLGSTGIHIADASINGTRNNNTTNSQILDCNFSDLSATAIGIGNSGSDYTIDNIKVKRNTITNVACEYKGEVGIFVGLVHNIEVSDNIISNLPYCGIWMGYNWGHLNTLGNWVADTTVLDSINIAYNTIDSVMNTLRDGGGIHNVGVHKQQSYISGNTITSITGSSNTLPPRCAIYLDSHFCDGLTIQDNTGDKIDLWDDRNLDIFTYLIRDTSCQSLNFSNNIFGDNSFWIKRNDFITKEIIIMIRCIV